MHNLATFVVMQIQKRSRTENERERHRNGKVKVFDILYYSVVIFLYFTNSFHCDISGNYSLRRKK